MNQRIKVSVVLPSFNHRSYVTQAITSILDQSWPDIDLIVIDDGSTDGSQNVIHQLHEERGGFRFYERQNKGLIKTLKEGLEMAEGTFFCALASDDFLPHDSIALRAQFLLNHPECIAVFGRMSGTDENAAALQAASKDKQSIFSSSSDPIIRLIKGDFHIPLHTLLMHKDLLREIGGFDPRYQYCEDLDIMLLLLLRGKVGVIDDIIYYYRRHGNNSTATNPNIARADKVLLYHKYLNEIPALHPYKNLIMHRLRRQYLLLGRYLTEKGGWNDRERAVFEGGWQFAWRDPRLLWHLLIHQFRKKGTLEKTA